MKRAILFALAVGILAVVFSSCTRRCNHCDRYDERTCPDLAWGDQHHRRGYGDGHRYGYEYLLEPREFFDAVDFGRGHDSLYGNPHGRCDFDCDHWRGREYRHRRSSHGWNSHSCPHRHRPDRDYEDALSERHAPFIPHDMEYDE